MKKINVLLIFIFSIITACNSVTEFESDNDFLKWLSGKEFTSIGNDGDHYYSDGSMGLANFPLTIQFDGDKVKYQNCSPTSYNFYKTSDGSYKVTFLPDCTKGDEVELIVSIKDEVYTVNSKIYDKSRISHTSGNAIALLDEAVKSETSYGASMKITQEGVKISGTKLSTIYDYTKIENEASNKAVDSIKTSKADNKPTYDINSEIALIKKNFYTTTNLINKGNVAIDTLTSEEDYPYREIVYTSSNGEVLLIIQGSMSNACYDVDEYYFYTDKLYFSYSHYDGASCRNNQFRELRKYIYQDHVIKIIADKKEQSCSNNCELNLESPPYKTLRKYYSLQGN